MRAFLLAAIVIAPCIAFAAPKKLKAAVPAIPAVPVDPSATPKNNGTLIDSDLGGRDLAFLSDAIGEGKMLRFLASQAERTANPDLRGFGADLVKALAAQSAVLNTVAGMRRLPIPAGQSETERRIAAKVAELDGVKLEKVLLDEFRTVDRRAVSTYELGLASQDQTIRKLCEQTLPLIRGHLTVVDSMAGIAPKHTPGEIAAIEKPASPATASIAPVPGLPPIAAPPVRPAFRANVQLPGGGAPATGR